MSARHAHAFFHSKSTRACSNHCPFHISGNILPDLTSFEEPLCVTQVTIALDQQGKIRHVCQAGPGQKDASNPAALFTQCLKLARARYTQLEASLQQQ